MVAASPGTFASNDPADTGGKRIIAASEPQGDCFTCAAFAVVAAAQAAVASTLQVDVVDVRLSTQDLYFCGSKTLTCR